MAFDGTLKFDTAIDQSGFKTGISNLGSIAKAGMAAVTTAVTAATGAISALGGYSISVGKDFESSMAQVIATMGITKDTIQDGVNSYDLLKESAAAAGESTVFSASEAADALNYLALAGYDAAKAADALPAVLNLAAAGGMDLAYASDLATDAMAALGIEATSENLTRFGDEMAKTASKANTNVSQLGEAILTVGGTAQSLAGGTVELNAALGVLANRGIKGAEGGTHLRNMILSLSAPTDTAKDALDALGVSALDASGNMRPLNATFSDLNAALAGMSDGEKAEILSDIFNKTDLAAAQGMLAGCGEEFDNLAIALNNCDGAMAQMADTMNDTLEGDMKSLESKAEAFGIAIYENMNDPLRELAQLGGEYLSQLTDAFNEGGFEGLAESFGDVLGQAVTKIAEYLPKMADMGASVVTELVNGLLANMDTISQAASDIGITIVECAVQIIPQLLTAAIEMIGALAQGLAENLPQLIDAAEEGLAQLVEGIKQNLPVFADAGISIILTLAEAFVDSLPMLLDAGLAIVSELAQALLDNLPEIIASVGRMIDGLIDYIAEGQPKVLEVVQKILTGIVDALPELLGALTSALPGIIKSIIEMLTSYVPQFLKCAINLFTSIVDALPEIVDELSKSLPDIVMAIVTALVEAIPQIASASVEMFMAIVDALPEVLVSLAEALDTLLSNIGEALGEVIIYLVEWSQEMRQKAIDAASGFLENAKTFFKELPGNIADFLKNALSKAAEWAVEMRQKAIDSASEFLENISKSLSELPGNIADHLKSAILRVAEWAFEMRQKAIDTASGFLDNIKTFFKELPGNIAEQLKAALQSVVKWGSNLKEKAKEAASGLVDKIQETIESLPSKMLDAGKNLVEGLWNGITSAGSWLKEKISGFADGIISDFKSAFGIHSPSTLMRDLIGKNLAEGIGVGFTEEMPDIGVDAVKAMKQLEFEIDSDAPRISVEADIPEIDDSAVAALDLYGSPSDPAIARPSATSEVINNSYNYSTVHNNGTDGNPQPVQINAQFIVGDEVVAEGVVDVAADGIDERQGVTVKMKKRGLAT